MAELNMTPLRSSVQKVTLPDKFPLLPEDCPGHRLLRRERKQINQQQDALGCAFAETSPAAPSTAPGSFCEYRICAGPPRLKLLCRRGPAVRHPEGLNPRVFKQSCNESFTNLRQA